MDRVIIIILIALTTLSCISISRASADPVSGMSSLTKQGYAQISRGSYHLAISTLRSAIRSNPNDLAARRYLCKALMQIGLASQAVAHMQVVVKNCPEGAAEWACLADAQRLCGENEAARLSYEKALSREKSNPDALLGLSKVMVSLGEIDQARNLCLSGMATCLNQEEKALFKQQLFEINRRAADVKQIVSAASAG